MEDEDCIRFAVCVLECTPQHRHTCTHTAVCLFEPSSLQVPSDGADGRQPLSGDSDGAGSREAVLPALPDVVWHQTPARRRDHTQGKSRRRSARAAAQMCPGAGKKKVLSSLTVASYAIRDAKWLKLS